MLSNTENIQRVLEKKLAIYKYSNSIKIPKKIYYKKIKCLTLEDIFYCHERNRDYYEDDELEVLSLSIGYSQIEKYKTDYKNKRKLKKKKSILDNLKTKHYIQKGEECPICYEKIIYKSHAYLTNCGHSFHIECITNYYNINYSSEQLGFCPLCRQDAGDEDGIKDIYINSSSAYCLDRLESFWNNIKITIPKKCSYYNYEHNLGFNKSCVKCTKYRNGSI